MISKVQRKVHKVIWKTANFIRGLCFRVPSKIVVFQNCSY